jgi:serine/threonine protein kinase
MQRGSLRSVLNTAESWQQYTPVMRHQILCDVTEALTYLHGQNVFHRDLKRYAQWRSHSWYWKVTAPCMM